MKERLGHIVRSKEGYVRVFAAEAASLSFHIPHLYSPTGMQKNGQREPAASI